MPTKNTPPTKKTPLKPSPVLWPHRNQPKRVASVELTPEMVDLLGDLLRLNYPYPRYLLVQVALRLGLRILAAKPEMATKYREHFLAHKEEQRILRRAAGHDHAQSVRQTEAKTKPMPRKAVLELVEAVRRAK